MNLPAPLPQSGRTAMMLVVGCVACMASAAWAQEKFKVIYDSPAAITKYTQQHAIDLGDAPGHQMRLFEIQRTYADGPVINGVRLKEAWTRGLSDYQDLNGSAQIHTTYVMENGDRMYLKGSLTNQSSASNDGKTTSRNLVSLNIVGGTGKFANVRGISRSEGVSNQVTGYNINKTELEYWVVK